MSKRFNRIYIEIGNVCNLSCSFCPPVERQKKIMTPAQFEQTLLAVKPWTDEITMHLMGEPLGHPRFKQFVELAGTLGFRIFLVTNGTMLRPELIDTILSPAVRQVNISLQSFTNNYPGRSPSDYLEKIFTLTRLALQKRPDLYVNLRIWDLLEPASLTPENQEIRNCIGKEFSVDLEQVQIDVRRRKNLPLSGRVYLHFDSRFLWPSFSLPFRSKQGTCHGLRSHVGILSDGTVVPCCLDKEALIPLGNIFTSGFDDAINSPRAQSMKAGFESGQLVEDLCQRCDFVKRFRRKAKSVR